MSGRRRAARGARLALALLLPLGLAGCYDYRGLDMLEPVAGIYVDLAETAPGAPLQLSLTNQIIDIAASGAEEEEKTRLLTTEGDTIQECVYRANQQIPKDMYFGNAEILVVSERFAREVGLSPLLEELIRDFNIRDTMLVMISRAESAKALVEPTIKDTGIVSYLLAANLDYQRNTAKSVTALTVFEVYETIEEGTSCAALPAYRFEPDADPPQPMGDGIAYFQGDKLAGFLEEEESEYFLYTIPKSNGRSLVYYLDGDDTKRVTLLLHDTKMKRSFSYADGRLSLTMRYAIDAEIVGMTPAIGKLDQPLIDIMERQADAAMQARIGGIVSTMQQRGHDIFAFGTDVYRHDPALWRAIEADWSRTFRDAEVRVGVDVNIERTGLITNY